MIPILSCFVRFKFGFGESWGFLSERLLWSPFFWLFSLTCTPIHIQHIYNARTHGLTPLGREIWRLSSPRSSSSAFWFAHIGLQFIFSFHSAARFGDYVFFLFFLTSFFLLEVFFFFTQTLSLASSHLHSHTYFFFRALGDFSFTASRWPRSLLLSLSGSNLESFRIRNPNELFWGFKRKQILQEKN